MEDYNIGFLGSLEKELLRPGASKGWCDISCKFDTFKATDFKFDWKTNSEMKLSVKPRQVWKTIPSFGGSFDVIALEKNCDVRLHWTM